MKIDLTELEAARQRQRENRGMAHALMAKLGIGCGYSLAPLLGQPPTKGNLEAVQHWLEAWRLNDAADCLDLDLAARSLLADIDGSLQ